MGDSIRVNASNYQFFQDLRRSFWQRLGLSRSVPENLNRVGMEAEPASREVRVPARALTLAEQVRLSKSVANLDDEFIDQESRSQRSRFQQFWQWVQDKQSTPQAVNSGPGPFQRHTGRTAFASAEDLSL